MRIWIEKSLDFFLEGLLYNWISHKTQLHRFFGHAGVADESRLTPVIAIRISSW
jgi:hypothetical protein